MGFLGFAVFVVFVEKWLGAGFWVGWRETKTIIGYLFFYNRSIKLYHISFVSTVLQYFTRYNNSYLLTTHFVCVCVSL